MASVALLTNVFERLGAIGGVDRLTDTRAWVRQAPSEQVKPLPGEAVCSWVYEVDNAGVVPLNALEAARACARSVVLSLVIALVFVGMLAPFALELLMSHELNRLEERAQLLQRQVAELEAQEAQLLSPGQLRMYGQQLGLGQPAPGRMATLQGTTRPILARTP